MAYTDDQYIAMSPVYRKDYNAKGSSSSAAFQAQATEAWRKAAWGEARGAYDRADKTKWQDTKAADVLADTARNMNGPVSGAVAKAKLAAAAKPHHLLFMVAIVLIVVAIFAKAIRGVFIFIAVLLSLGAILVIWKRKSSSA